MAKNKLGLAEIKGKVREHLSVALDIEEFSITFAKLEADTWKVNIEFKEKSEFSERVKTKSALFAIDAWTGEVKEFSKGYAWEY